MVIIDGQEYLPKTPMNKENGEYNSALIFYQNYIEEIKELNKQLKELNKQLEKYKKLIKKLVEED